jgi:hypothetical protein
MEEFNIARTSRTYRAIGEVSTCSIGLFILDVLDIKKEKHTQKLKGGLTK